MRAGAFAPFVGTGVYWQCGGRSPRDYNWGCALCAAGMAGIAAAGAAGTAGALETAGSPPCPPSLTCPSTPAAVPPSIPAGPSTCPSPPSSGTPVPRTRTTPAAAAAADRPGAALRGGYIAPPEPSPQGRNAPSACADGAFFMPCIPCGPVLSTRFPFFCEKICLTNLDSLLKCA